MNKFIKLSLFNHFFVVTGVYRTEHSLTPEADHFREMNTRSIKLQKNEVVRLNDVHLFQSTAFPECIPRAITGQWG